MKPSDLCTECGGTHPVHVVRDGGEITPWHYGDKRADEESSSAAAPPPPAFVSDDGSDPDAPIPFRPATWLDRLYDGGIAAAQQIIGPERTFAFTAGVQLMLVAVRGSRVELAAVVAELAGASAPRGLVMAFDINSPTVRVARHAAVEKALFISDRQFTDNGAVVFYFSESRRASARLFSRAGLIAHLKECRDKRPHDDRRACLETMLHDVEANPHLVHVLATSEHETVHEMVAATMRWS